MPIRTKNNAVIRRRPTGIHKRSVTVTLDPRVLRRIEQRARVTEKSVSGWMEEVCILALTADTRMGKAGRVVTTAAGLEEALRESVGK